MYHSKNFISDYEGININQNSIKFMLIFFSQNQLKVQYNNFKIN